MRGKGQNTWMTPGGPCSDCIEMSFRHDLHWRGIFVVGMRPQPLPRTSKAPHFLGIFRRDFCLTIGGDFIPSKVSIIAALSGSSNPSTGGRFCPSKRLSIQENNFILPPQINMRNRPDQGAQESIPLPQDPPPRRRTTRACDRCRRKKSKARLFR